MEKVSAVIATFNEEENIADCIKSVQDADEIIVNDDSSTDNTVKIAKSLGAKVVTRPDFGEYPTAEDVKDFEKRFGWKPLFEEGKRIRNGHLESSFGVNSAKYDWVIVPDADERITWKLDKLRKEVLPNADQIIGQFVHSHKEDGSPERMSTIIKMFRKSVTQIDGRTHTCIIPYGRIVETNLLRVDHWQKFVPNRQIYVRPILEYCVLKDDDQRSRFYLGREYYYYHEYDKALKILDIYFKDATWMPEIAQARLYQARCYWESGQGDKARESALQAFLINPDQKETCELMSEMYFEPWKSKWAYIAQNATNKDILF